CRAGDAGAFEELYRQHARRLFSLVVRMIGSVDEAEDLLQEVFLQAHRKLSGFRGDSALGTWLYRLTMNHCLDHLRARPVRSNRVHEWLGGAGPEEPIGPGPIAPAAVSRLDLERAINMLPDGARAAFLLHDVEGF